MSGLDYAVLAGYFLLMAGIGVLCMLAIRRQEDYFLGGRSFGKLLQTFAAFGAGTGANDPVTLGRTTYTSGLSGIWGVLLWLFATPFYWFFGVWFRRMRHLTLGDWYVERYESRALGAAYALFALWFGMMHLSVGFSAVGKVCAPLMNTDYFVLSWVSSEPIEIEYVLVPIIALVVIVYGVLGGLRAAYWTDLIQGLMIILLSVILIPFGLAGLVEKFGDPSTMSLFDGFRIMHERMPAENFQIFESPRGGEFPLHYIAAITLINLIGVAIQPHQIATGGGSARSELSARAGLVMGNFLKRGCTLAWAMTVLIALALLPENLEIARDPDRTWGVAAREILGPLQLGLVGLMLACLLAALMSTSDCYMLVLSALVVRNLYGAYLNPSASDRQYLMLGRLVSVVVISGAAIVSLTYLNVLEQLKITWEIPMIFAGPFWVGLFWRRATRWACWLTIGFTTVTFFLLPLLLPALMPSLRTHPDFNGTNQITTTIIARHAAPDDVAKREAALAIWQQHYDAAQAQTDPAIREAELDRLGPQPEPLALGDPVEDRFVGGGKAIFWTGGVEPLEGAALREVSRVQEGNMLVITEAWEGPARGLGYFNLDFLMYELMGLDMTRMNNAALETLRLPPKIIAPFLLMVLFSLITPAGSKAALDRYYVKMKTPVAADPLSDLRELELSYAQPDRFDYRRLFHFAGLEFQRPTLADSLGFVGSVIGCFVILWIAVWMAGLGT